MEKEFGRKRIAPPEDIRYGPQFDLLDNKVYARKKKEAKGRECFINLYAPNCGSLTYAQAQHNQRSMIAPYGDQNLAKDGVIRERLPDDSKLAVRVCSLCKIHHSAGDAFAVKSVWPSIVLQFVSFKEL